ncbi:putative metallopeptidase [Duganella aquatilis]|uniref:putative metallopeptidase n=1 Tax=Duganella aquatilis TaxID=2666082 RepID=UPI00140DEBDB
MASRDKTQVRHGRPSPPTAFADPLNCRFAPAPEVLTWARGEILTEGGQLHNPDHAHLEYCDVQFLWAPGSFNKQGRTVIGQCEEMLFRCGPWQKGRQQQQMTDWFGMVPDYLITLDASYCLTCSDAEFCALVEHELMHIGQEIDEFGSPKFTKEGLPKLTLRAHDIEEFVGVVARYGATPEIQRLIDAVAAGPTVSSASISRACGTCSRG